MKSFEAVVERENKKFELLHDLSTSNMHSKFLSAGELTKRSESADITHVQRNRAKEKSALQFQSSDQRKLKVESTPYQDLS